MSTKISKSRRRHLIAVARRNEFHQSIRELNRLGVLASGLILGVELPIARSGDLRKGDRR